MTAQPSRIAFIGSGNIAGPYAESLARHPEVQLVGVFDLDQEKSQAFASAHAIASYANLDELCSDAPDIVVNLTSAPFHYETTRELIERGQTVFSEKPLAMEHSQAAELVDLAVARNQRLAGAPSLWLGAAQLAAADALREGAVGTVRLINAEVNQGRIESWHPAPFTFYQVGPVADAGVYPLTYLTAVFGRIRRVTAVSATLLSTRTTLDGETFEPKSPDAWFIVAEFASGPLLRLTCTFYNDSAAQPRFIEFQGDSGSLRLDDWLLPGSSLSKAEFGEGYSILRETDEDCPLDWSLGVLDLAASLLEDRPHRTRAAHAAHVVEVLDAIAESSRIGAGVDVHSDFESALPLVTEFNDTTN